MPAIVPVHHVVVDRVCRADLGPRKFLSSHATAPRGGRQERAHGHEPSTGRGGGPSLVLPARSRPRRIFFSSTDATASAGSPIERANGAKHPPNLGVLRPAEAHPHPQKVSRFQAAAREARPPEIREIAAGCPSRVAEASREQLAATFTVVEARKEQLAALFSLEEPSSSSQLPSRNSPDAISSSQLPPGS